MSALEEMLDDLAVCDVHAGFPAERLALARQLLHEGVTGHDVALLASHCRATVDGPGAVRVLVSLLVDSAKREARLIDLREIEARKALRARRTANGDVNRQATPPPAEPWDHDRQCRVAWCRVNGDRADPGVVARELGVTDATLQAMLDRGRAISQSPLITPLPKRSVLEAEDHAEDERRKAFREQMLAARQVSP